MSIKYLFVIFTVAFLTLFFTCRQHAGDHREKKADVQTIHTLVNRDIEQIKKRGKLVVLTDNSSTSYFIYRGQPMGYEYELAKLFADNMGVELEIKVEENMNRIFEDLNSGIGDIAAANITVTRERKKKVAFTKPYLFTRQVLVQRLPDGYRNMSEEERDKALIRNPVDLIGKQVTVRRNASFYNRLVSLGDEIGGDIDIVEAPGGADTEWLIRQVAEGKIPYTVADENVARINKTYYRNIDIETAISFPQQIAWAVRPNAPMLLQILNLWLNSMQHNPEYLAINDRYFDRPKSQARYSRASFSSLSDGQVSPYDDLIKEASKTLGWDWRLLAAQVYEESGFNPEAVSWSGAYGLMQLMPATASDFAVADYRTPEGNISAGVSYLIWLDKYWKDKIQDKDERIYFVLASYNAGLGHVCDARKLCAKYKGDPGKWDNNVADYLLLKSRAMYYNDTCVQYGYCRGSETYFYVRDVMDRYQHYKNQIS